MAGKPSAPSVQRNREPIAQALAPFMADRRRVLEIGSGTGEHALYFAGLWPHLQWQPSDHADHLTGIDAWRAEAALPNLLPALALQAALPPAPALALPAGTAPFDAVFSANTLHIMSWEHVQALFAGLPSITVAGAVLAVYGPFNHAGGFTSQSNAQFDAWLKARDARSGIRDAEAVQALAAQAGFSVVDDLAMPANNRLLVWRRG